MKSELKEIQKQINRDKTFKAKLRKLFLQHSNELEKEIRSYVLDYEEIKLEEHFYRANKDEIDKLREEVEDAKKSVGKDAAARIAMLYLGYRMTKNKVIETKVDVGTIKLADDEIKLIESYLRKEVTREASRMNKLLNLKDKTLNIDKIINSENYKATFSQRVWRDQVELRNRLITNLNKSIAQGQNPKTWARDLKDLVNKDFKHANYAAERIAITESARMQIDMQEEAFERNGTKHWVWVAEPTACPDCAALDGEIFEVGTIDPLPGYIHPFVDAPELWSIRLGA